MDWSKLLTTLTKHNPLFSVISKYTGAGLTGAEYEQNQFNAEQSEINRIFNSNEAALQRNWSAAEAERARDWQEEMYSKYNSLSGKIAQAEQAGVNPMLAVTGNAVSPMAATSSSPSGVAASGSAASGGGFASSAFTDLIGQMIGLKKLDAEVDVLESEAEKNRAEAEGQQITNDQLHDMNAAEIMSKLSNVQLNTANVGLIASKVLNTDADTDLKIKQLDEVGANIANSEADTAYKQQLASSLVVQMAKDAKSIEVFTSQIGLMATQAGVNRNESALIIQQLDNLAQEYGFNELIKCFEVEAAQRELGSNNWYNSKALPAIKRTIDSLLGWWSGSSTVELPQKKPARIGFK